MENRLCAFTAHFSVFKPKGQHFVQYFLMFLKEDFDQKYIKKQQ